MDKAIRCAHIWPGDVVGVLRAGTEYSGLIFSQINIIMGHIIAGLQFIHSHRVLYGKLNPRNGKI